eukprot:768058-Hanusia_phi.AAC.5
MESSRLVRLTSPPYLSHLSISDFFVVAVSVLSEIVQGIPGLNALRLIRIFKMIRVFRSNFLFPPPHPRLSAVFSCRMLYSFRVLINALSSSGTSRGVVASSSTVTTICSRPSPQRLLHPAHRDFHLRHPRNKTVCCEAGGLLR